MGRNLYATAGLTHYMKIDEINPRASVYFAPFFKCYSV
jgi:hypothetical protein